MSWVRIHDGALSHPKIVGMVDTRRPFDLWVWGLSYAQLHLTDGRIPTDAVPRLAGKAAQELCRRGLWEARNEGFLIHDHLDWNDSRELVKARKRNAKKRKQEWLDRHTRKESGTRSGNDLGTGSERVPNTTHNQTEPNQYVRTDPSDPSYEKNDPPAASRSSPPAHGTQHGRIFVHPWQLLELIDTLGPHASTFDLDAWVLGLSALADSKGLVLEKKDVWGWVKQQLSEEIRRRGLPVANSEPSVDDRENRLRRAVAEQEAARVRH